MELANAIVSIGGDHGNTVGKYNVTPSEVAVLRAIHGDDAVNELKIVATVNRTNRAELERLAQEYGSARDNDNRPILGQLFPGIAARVFEKFKELDLDDSVYAAPERPKPVRKPKAEPAEEVITAYAPEPEPEPEAIDEIGDEPVGEDMDDMVETDTDVLS